MQIHNFSYRIRGFLRIADYAVRWEDMVSEKGKHKARVLSFWARHGLQATEEAFGVKRRTLYYWREQLIQGGGKLEALNEKSKAPHRRRRRMWPDAVIMGNKVLLRAERSGTANGRIYQVNFDANDGQGGVCSGLVKAGVPHSMKPGMDAVDDGQLYDSTQP